MISVLVPYKSTNSYLNSFPTIDCREIRDSALHLHPFEGYMGSIPTDEAAFGPKLPMLSWPPRRNGTRAYCILLVKCQFCWYLWFVVIWAIDLTDQWFRCITTFIQNHDQLINLHPKIADAQNTLVSQLNFELAVLSFLFTAAQLFHFYMFNFVQICSVWIFVISSVWIRYHVSFRKRHRSSTYTPKILFRLICLQWCAVIT